MPCDHFSLQVPQSKFDALITFLTTALSPLGFKEFWRPIPQVAGLGDARPYLWVSSLLPEGVSEEIALKLLAANHIAFTAQSTDQVDQFHAAGLKAGGTCNGPPGVRPQYHKGYYAAFVRDPAVGLNFEVVFHGYAGAETGGWKEPGSEGAP